jgi:ribosomal protein S18 acetylase RimI-like enzyme
MANELSSAARQDRVRVEAAAVEDSRAIAQVQVISWQVAYEGIVSSSYLASLSTEQREVSWGEALLEGSPKVLVARVDGRIVGFIAFGACRDQGALPNWGEVWALYVLPSHWSAGVGRALWLGALESQRAQGLNPVTLWVLTRNERGIRFYEAAGFKVEPGSKKVFSMGGSALEEYRLIHEDGV